jgi:hypothetical protein
MAKSIIEHPYSPVSQHPRRDAAIDGQGNTDNAIAWRPGATEKSLSWAMRLLPVKRRKAAYAV